MRTQGIEAGIMGLKRNRKTPWLTTAAVALFLCGTAIAQDRAQHPDLTGLWLIQDPGSGSFGAFVNNIPAPQLRPEIIKQNQEAEAKTEQTVFHNLDDHTGCTEGGEIVLMMESSPALNILPGKNETLIGADSSRARFIYTGGRQHQDIHSPNYHATGFGDSIGHWEGDTFVVDTIGFPARMCGGRTPYLVTPRGGRALPSTHLTERYDLNADHSMLTITFTWEDPNVYLAPHTYSYNYKFLPEAVPFESEDSQRDAAYQQRLRTSVAPPPQK
jgi:hypothetical protein